MISDRLSPDFARDDDPVDPLELPKWHVDLGFELSVWWTCGCELTGYSHTPLNFRKRCPLHGSYIDQIMVAIDNDQEVITDNPGYSYYPVRSWPKGTFARRSPQAMRRLEINRNRLSAAVDRPRGQYREKELIDFARQIEHIDELARSIAMPKARDKVLSITKSA